MNRLRRQAIESLLRSESLAVRIAKAMLKGVSRGQVLDQAKLEAARKVVLRKYDQWFFHLPNPLTLFQVQFDSDWQPGRISREQIAGIISKWEPLAPESAEQVEVNAASTPAVQVLLDVDAV